MFVHESPADLADVDTQATLIRSLGALDEALPLRVGSSFGGTDRRGDAVRSVDPSDPRRAVALSDAASPEDVDAAVEVARGGAEAWASLPADQRAATLRNGVDLLRARRAELAALMVREAGKPWDEADGEIAEAIDLIHLYSAGIEQLPALLSPPRDGADRNWVRLIPRGVTAVIAPWNFPIAMPLGMTVAALAGGNPVVLKPAEQTPACGAAVVRLLRDAGVPAAALSLLQGGGEVGARLVRHRAVATIAFTGSSDVGGDIARAAADSGFKRFVAEMGGKNCAVVACGADLESATRHLVQSAFSYAGQKCSAISRVLVQRELMQEVSERLAAAIEALVVGRPSDFATLVPPVIDAAASARLTRAIADAEAQGTVVSRARVTASDAALGSYVAPTLVGGLPDDSRLLRTELFGPLLTLEGFATIDEAASRVDRLPQALTGGIYSEDDEIVARLVERSPVGNLYVNRPTVGARVIHQPFGGGRLSGTGHKTGRMDYVAAFCEQQVVSRRLAPSGGSGRSDADGVSLAA